MAKLKLLVPLDASPFSRQVLPQVRRLFPPEGAELTLLHVPAPSEAGAPPPLEGAHYAYGSVTTVAPRHTFDKEGLDEATRALAGRLEADAERVREHGYDVRVLVRPGAPVEEIVAAVERERIDLVAMTTHGRSGLGRLVMGSVAQAVVARLSVPVLLLHGDPSAPSEEEVLGPVATLGGRRGRGELTLLRAADGRLLEARGSWRPDDPEADLDELIEAARERRPVVFRGPVRDPAGAEGGAEVELPARVTGMHRYRDDGGRELLLVNFVRHEG